MEPPDSNREEIFKDLIAQFASDTPADEPEPDSSGGKLIAVLAELGDLYDQTFSVTHASRDEDFSLDELTEDERVLFDQNTTFFDMRFSEFAEQVISRFAHMGVDIDAKIVLAFVYGIQIQILCATSPILSSLYSGGNEHFAMAVAGRLSKMLIEGEL